METNETKKTTPLVKRSTSYKIVIPAAVERIIRFLCERVWDTEWSGVLFYTPTGNFEDGSLEIHCVDIFPMDIGNATYTEFNMSPDVITYMTQKPELLDCKMGLIHSHNNMSTFFSGTDISTLREEGDERNHFVSLIVNNAGKYTAAITRKIKYHSVRDLSYEGFNGTVALDGKEEFDGEEIEYFNLDIVMEEVETPGFKDIADRLAEIKKAKTARPTTPAAPVAGFRNPTWGGSPVPTTGNIYKGKWGNDPTLFDDDDVWTRPNANPLAERKAEVKPEKEKANLEPFAGEVVTPADVEKAIIQLVTGSVTITSLDKETKDKLVKTMVTRFDNRFGKGDVGLALFKYWATDFIEFLLWYSFGDRDVDECEAASEYATKIVSALEKLPKNKYIDKYIELFVGYADKF